MTYRSPRPGPCPGYRTPDPCPSAFARRATDQRIAGRRLDLGLAGARRVPRDGSHLDNWIVSAELNESSISPSRNNEMIPIDPIQRLAAWSEAGGGQATKGTGWMPWRQEPKKDVAGCEKLRGVASRL